MFVSCKGGKVGDSLFLTFIQYNLLGFLNITPVLSTLETNCMHLIISFSRILFIGIFVTQLICIIFGVMNH